MAEFRYLVRVEIDEARKVFASSLTYDNIIISNFCGEGAVTLAGRKLDDISNWIYTLCWSDAVLRQNVIGANQQKTFIHEMTHVWQGQHGIYPTVYMAQSLLSQLFHGVEDIIRKREWRTWGEHRNTTYRFNWSDIGKKWSDFNVEQQGNIVESWYIGERDRRRENRYYGEDVYGGGASPYDARFPYIRDVIRAGDRNASYRAIQLAQGASVEIKQIQDKLVALGYLEAIHADGIISRGNSPTVQAVRAFQGNNHLHVDGDMGTANSATRRKLQLPVSQLNPAP